VPIRPVAEQAPLSPGQNGFTVLYRIASAVTLLALLMIPLTGCAATTAQSVPLPTPGGPPAVSPSPAQPIDAQLADAFRREEPAARRQAVLAATDRFLHDQTIRALDDSAVSTAYTDAAFASGALTLDDPALIRRRDDLAAVALPDGMGLVLYDLGAEAGAPPLELSRWTAGMRAMQVSWEADEVGVSYATAGRDGVGRVHYALAGRDEAGWRLMWLSDEAPDWWFNAVGGTLDVRDDREVLTVTGPAELTTEAFFELEGEPRRTFRLEWRRLEDGYVMAPAVESYPSRTAWLWDVAEPSPYATLVELVERLQRGDTAGAESLAASPAAFEAALAAGLQRPDRRYQVVEATGDRVRFRDVEATYDAVFRAPSGPSGDWLIGEITTLAIRTPVPTPTATP
jgi:hypothetical protein